MANIHPNHQQKGFKLSHYAGLAYITLLSILYILVQAVFQNTNNMYIIIYSLMLVGFAMGQWHFLRWAGQHPYISSESWNARSSL